MKKLIYILSTLAAMITVVASCEKSDADLQSVDPAIVGEWHLSATISEGNSDIEMPDVYLCINADCSFELYQKSGTQVIRYDKYTGTCFTQDGLLIGTYSTGDAWASKWEYSITSDQMTLKSFNMLEINTYAKVTIPDDVRDNANEVYTKASCTIFTPIL